MKKGGFSNNLKLSIPLAAEQSITKFLTQSGTFKDGDLRVNKDGVRIVSQSEPEVLPPIKPADDELSLSDLDMVKFIGKGSSGVVQLVQHKWTGQFFALKVIQLNIDEATRKAIAQELKINQSSQCPYLVTSYQSFYDNGAISLILEYMDGGSLADFLKSVKTIPESYLSAIFKQVLQGLIYLHHDRHIIHRDLKPSNLLINHRGEVKITDFSSANTFVGSYNYMSPERIVGNKYGNKSDIWSLGLVVLECATGKFPYLLPDQEETWSSVFELMEAIVDQPPPVLPSENFSPELSSFISTCLQKDPNSRSSAKELMEHPFLNKYNNLVINLASYFTDSGSPLATLGNLSEERKNSMDKENLFEKCLAANDVGKLFIGCRSRDDGDAAPRSDGDVSLGQRDYVLPDPRSVKKLKEVETPLQLRLPEHSIKGFVPILVISCADNQDSEETYFISYIVGELSLRGFTPIRYDITRSTVTGIQEVLYRSQIGIMIFSMNYARSRECLDELVAIMDHLRANNLITVFFKVNRSKLRLQSGSFERAFSRLGKSVQASQVLKWRTAMIELTSINRYQYMKGNEVMLAKNIVRDVCSLLNSETNRNLKGTSLQLKSILSLLHCSQSSAPHFVGLWGMAGIGKTTITREIFRRQAERYEVCYFLPDFHLMCQTKGLSHLHDEFFSKIFGVEKVFIDACDTKLGFTRDRFLNKRVLIVLDGVSDARDAEVLLGGFGWFSGGHKIILTSRNRQVLVQCNAKEIYKIQKLSEPESLSLCCQFATEQNWKGRMSLISELVSYASGIPLALRVLGSSVQKQCLDNEKQHLRRLRQHPPIDIQDAFRSSFNGLDDNEKNIFLDLACFFRGENKDRVVNILDGCGLFTDLGIYALIDESLVTLVDNMIEMPNIFQDTGRYVVCQENNEAGKRSRLWDSNDIVDVLTNNSGTEAIEGIFLDASDLTFELNPAVFERMYRLRLLKLHCPTSENHYNVCLPQGLHSLPDELRLLHWERYHLRSLPRNFNPKNLVELNMPYSNLTKLWKGTKNLEKLKKIILSHSRQLTKLPRLSKARNLEHIDLEGCTSLVKVNSSILHHHKLTFLSLKDCSHLRIMPTTAHLESLEVLNLSGCSELEDLQDFSPNLKELYLAGTAIIEMPSSIRDLTRLVTLDLENCERLHHLPPGISNLKAMVTLNLSGCSNLKSLPVLDALFLQDSQRLNTRITMESVSLNRHSAIQESRDAVEEFLPAFEYLSRNRIPQESWPRVTIPVPSSILHSLASRLYAVVSLFLCNAYLVDVPEELCWLASVMTLDLGGNSFSQIPKSIKELCKLHSLRLRHCKNLKSLPELPRSLVILNAHGCVSLESFPSSFEQFPRHYTFSNCFKLSPKVVRKYIGKALDSVEGMAKGLLQEHINAPAFSICIPASASHQSSVNFQAGSSVMVELTPGMLKCLSGFSLSVVIEFWDNYSNAAGFGIKCICRKTRTDLSPRSERIFHCWGPKEPTTVQRDHMFVFGCVKMHHAEAIIHDFLDDLVTFEFHPVNWENQLLNDSCTVKRCGVYFITAATCNTTLSAKRPSSSMDPGGLSSVDHMAPPYKRCRLKEVIETVVLSLRKRKRDKSVSTVKNRSNSEFGESEFGVSVKPRRSYSDGSMKPRGSYIDGSVRDAAIRIQTDFRGYKCRKQHLIARQGIVLIQARWRGYQVRKSYRNLILSMEY